jgi:hypothetical protein
MAAHRRQRTPIGRLPGEATGKRNGPFHLSKHNNVRPASPPTRKKALAPKNRLTLFGGFWY